MLKNIGLFCKRDLQKRPIFCKETYIFKHPDNLVFVLLCACILGGANLQRFGVLLYDYVSGCGRGWVISDEWWVIICDRCATACATTHSYVTQQHLLIRVTIVLVHMWHTCNKTDSCVPYATRVHMCGWCWVLQCVAVCCSVCCNVCHTQHLFICDATILNCIWHMCNNTCNNTDSYVTQQHWFKRDICATTLIYMGWLRSVGSIKL